jgi:hypothetical protein
VAAFDYRGNCPGKRIRGREGSSGATALVSSTTLYAAVDLIGQVVKRL